MLARESKRSWNEVTSESHPPRHIRTGESWLYLVMGASNDVGSDKAVSNAFTRISTSTHSCVNRSGLSANHHRDVSTSDILTADQLHLGSFRHCIGSLNGRHHASGLNHAKGDTKGTLRRRAHRSLKGSSLSTAATSWGTA
jgi:hypothetical protein